jgi:uncharacterized protein YndB with AHSA1/START domain
MTEPNRSNEIRLVRLYDAPVAIVWDAWTDPEQVKYWWGPRGFSLTTHSHDLRPGGHWRYTMHGPDGTDYENRTLYHEVVRHTRLMYDHGGNEDRPPLFRVTVLFSETDGRTRMDMTMTLETPEAATEIAGFIKKAGGNATWDRLAEYLEQEASGKALFVINRSFDAPVERVFAAWTDPRQIARWLPPSGFDMEYLRADIRSGGNSFYRMSNGSLTMYGRAEYLEIEQPRRIVYTQQFCDEHENVSRHPLAPTWPATMLTHIDFVEEGPERTRVTVRWEVHGAATADEMDTFVKGRAGMTLGWTGSFDKLEAVLAQPLA